jgi:hypothetical protein
MKKIATLLICFALVSSAFANNGNEEGKGTESSVSTTKLSGKVLDNITGESLAGVKITINNSEDCVYTDFDGNFVITNVKPGKVKISASYISYKEKTEVLNLAFENTNTVEVKIETLNK